MMRALRPEIANTLYELIADRVPEPPRHPNGGCRRRVPDRVCFEGIFWRFVTGAAWETVEAMLGYIVSDTTLRARRNEWVDAGVFHQLMEDCLAIYHQLIGIDMRDVAIDGSVQLAPGGGPDTNNSPGSKGRKTMKFHIGVDANGIGLGGLVVTAPPTTTRSCNPPSTRSAHATGPPRSNDSNSTPRCEPNCRPVSTSGPWRV